MLHFKYTWKDWENGSLDKVLQKHEDLTHMYTCVKHSVHTHTHRKNIENKRIQPKRINFNTANFQLLDYNNVMNIESSKSAKVRSQPLSIPANII